MCKLVYIKTKDNSAYSRAINMVKHQENVVAGHSSGFTFRTINGFSTRKSIGKINSFLVKYPNIPDSKEVLAHSRYATVGSISLENQHPISIMHKDTKIGYGIHNGTFSNYKDYEHYRSSGMVNQTDSALLFTLYSRVLEQLRDSPNNRRLAFKYIMELIKFESNHNLIIMFKDGQVLFSGNVLTFSNTNEKIGIMTFGLDKKVDEGVIYNIKGFDITKYNIRPPLVNIVRKPQKPKEKTSNKIYINDWRTKW